jgi:hypothetical protein
MFVLGFLKEIIISDGYSTLEISSYGINYKKGHNEVVHLRYFDEFFKLFEKGES